MRPRKFAHVDRGGVMDELACHGLRHFHPRFAVDFGFDHPISNGKKMGKFLIVFGSASSAPI